MKRATRSAARPAAAAATIAVAVLAGVAPAWAGSTLTGPSSSASPYIVPAAPGVDTVSILTVGDSVNDKPVDLGYPAGTPYRMAGIPDGLGAFDNGDGTFTLLMNHELRATAGVPRDHNVGVLGPVRPGVGDGDSTGADGGSNGATGGSGTSGPIGDPDAPVPTGGAFVSRWTISKAAGPDFLRVLKVEDQIKTVRTYNQESGSYEQSFDEIFNRFCSADLPKQTALRFDGGSEGKLGTDLKIFLNGEETSEGRAFAHVVGTGEAVELPRLGKYAFENVVANPFAQKKTLVVGLDDSDNMTGTTVATDEPSEVYLYVGNKTNSANPVEAAGLTNGSLFGVKVEGVFGEDKETGIGTPSRKFTLAGLGNAEGKSAPELQQASIDAGVTQFARVEDGQWDPSNPSHFYFVTTDEFNEAKFGQDGKDSDAVIDDLGETRLWRMKFDDITNPEAGGVIEMLLDGGEPTQMLDNMTISEDGLILMQEDVGDQEHNSKIWAYDPETDKLLVLAKHDPARFGDKDQDATDPFTQDEESSGIIDVSDILGKGWYLADVQAHKTGDAVDEELVELGQLVAIHVGDQAVAAIPLPGAVFMAPMAMGVAGFAYRRARRRMMN